ncbi:NAD-dependent histone deacetylase sir2 [Chytriomyces hyalinus]|nr:NAD-dependent histone deacetylase sir2 [Chytriomyces hyalinus]
MAKKKSSKAKAKSASAAPASAAPVVSMPNQALTEAIAAARAELDRCNPTTARDILLAAANADPAAANADLLELLGFTEMDLATSYHSEVAHSELGDSVAALIANHSEQAEIYLRKAVELGKDRVEPATYLYLGQLCLGAEAATFYERGIKGLEDEIEIMVLSGADDEDEINNLKRKISAALCSMTEIYMTDCCDDPLAEQNCTEFMARAQAIDPSSPDVHSTAASVLLSKCEPEAATESILRSISLWSLEEPNTWPTYPTRLASAKVLMECGKDEEASGVLETVLKENDEDLEVWYLFAWCYYRMGGGGCDEDMMGDTNAVSIDDKVDCWVDAKECLEKLLELAEKDAEADPGMLQHASEMLQEVSLLLAQHPDIVLRVEEGQRENVGYEDEDDEMEM